MPIRSTTIVACLSAAALAWSLPAPAAAHCGSCASDEAGKDHDHGHDHAHGHGHDHAKVKKPQDLVDTAVAAGSFTILAQALADTGLVEALKADGPFTVFAPTDEAFAKLPEGTLESLSKEDLANILKAHVVSGKIMAADAIKAKGTAVAALSGAELPVQVVDGAVTISNATVVKADVKASNGVIHVIDTVILPN